MSALGQKRTEIIFMAPSSVTFMHLINRSEQVTRQRGWDWRDACMGHSAASLIGRMGAARRGFLGASFSEARARATAPSLAQEMLAMSVRLPFGNLTRYILGYFASGTMVARRRPVVSRSSGPRHFSSWRP
jgi:hypothetical protein